MIVRSSTLLEVHELLKKQEHRLLSSSDRNGKPDTKAPFRQFIHGIVELKRRNPRPGCPRIAQQINKGFGINIDKEVVRRVLRPPPGGCPPAPPG
jgi:putative transposase